MPSSQQARISRALLGLGTTVLLVAGLLLVAPPGPAAAQAAGASTVERALPPPNPGVTADRLRLAVNAHSRSRALKWATVGVVDRMMGVRNRGYRYGSVGTCSPFDERQVSSCPLPVLLNGASKGLARIQVKGSSQTSRAISVTLPAAVARTRPHP